MTVTSSSGTAVGVVLPGEPVTLTVTVIPVGLNPQTTAYTGKVTIVASGAARDSQIAKHHGEFHSQ